MMSLHVTESNDEIFHLNRVRSFSGQLRQFAVDAPVFEILAQLNEKLPPFHETLLYLDDIEISNTFLPCTLGTEIQAVVTVSIDKAFDFFILCIAPPSIVSGSVDAFLDSVNPALNVLVDRTDLLNRDHYSRLRKSVLIDDEHRDLHDLHLFL